MIKQQNVSQLKQRAIVNFNFFITSMPESRPADYYLGCLEGSIFLGFNEVGNSKVCLTRISFDGYGCCDLKDSPIPLSQEDSEVFKKMIQNEIQDQGVITTIVKKAIALNKEQIWADALEEYKLI